MKNLGILLMIAAVLVESENPEENEGVDDPDLFEGDMILTSDQRMAAEQGLDVDNPFGRGSIKGRQWPNGVVPYVIDSNLSGYEKAMIAVKAGMQEWSSKTCIRFKERTSETGYLNFRLGNGCSSYVGTLGDRQHINLASGCWSRGIVAHEIGHALGFYHEQSRPDRDDYVTIVWDNIHEFTKNSFNKYNKTTIDSLGTPYDYGSVMHYGSKAFSKNRQRTIVPKQSGVTIGQRNGISDIDAQQMNLLYKSQCRETGGSCADKDPNNCPGWKSHCSYHSYVRANCKKTCDLC